MSARQQPPPRWQGAAAGIVTGFTGIAVALATTAVLKQRANPVQAVAELVRDITPGPLAEKLIHIVGRNDKPLLLTGVTLTLVALSALAGILARTSLLAGTSVFVLMGVVAGIASVSRSGATQSALIPVALGVTGWVVALSYLRPQPLRAEPPAFLDTTGADRRTFLLKLGGAAAVALVLGGSSRVLGKARRAVESARSLLRLPVTTGVVPAGADLDVEGLGPWRVSNDDFYRIDTALVIPTIQPANWQLRIHGKVDRPLTLSYDDLLKRQLTEAWITICCVSNPVGGELIGNAWWSGVRIADLLHEAGVHDDADAVLQTSKDGWTCGTPVKALTDDRNAMLAIAMNGEPLPLEHGFPVRMIVPGLYGFVSACKWLVDLEVTNYDKFYAYWTERGWSAKGPVKTESRIEVPRGGRAVAGAVPVAGTAWAQHTGIAKVEVRLDGDPWKPCELAAVPDDDTWVQWRTTVQATPGMHTLAVRATDKSGYTQTGAKQDVVPDGATGWHTIHFTAEG